jgi:hypothetical protein
MIPAIRLATEEELKPIADKSDLGPNTVVWAWPNDGKDSDLAVIRSCVELDPMWFAKTSGLQRKALFFWALLNMVKVTGTKEIYFDVDVDGSEEYISILEKMGAKRTTDKPQFRFKLGL